MTRRVARRYVRGQGPRTRPNYDLCRYATLLGRLPPNTVSYGGNKMPRLREDYRLSGPVRKDERRDNARLFAMDEFARGQYVGQQERPAKCYHIVRGDGSLIGFIWIAFSSDADATEMIFVHVDFVFVIPSERGGMSEWLAGKVVQKFCSWIKSCSVESGAGVTVCSTSNPVTREGSSFVLRLNAKLIAYCREKKFNFV